MMVFPLEKEPKIKPKQIQKRDCTFCWPKGLPP